MLKSMLSNLQIYSMFLLLAPILVLYKLERAWRDFLWGYDGEVWKFHLMGWDKNCWPTKQGGLGLKDSLMAYQQDKQLQHNTSTNN